MSYAQQCIIAGATLVATFGIYALSVNRLVRSKLRLSLLVLAGYLALSAFLAVTPVSAEAGARLQSIAHLLLALGITNLFVVLLINPWRVDKVPEKFPNIVQDAIVIGIFLVVATFVMEEKFMTTSAVGAVVIGFALQDTLGNTFAGLAIQVEKPFRVGHWVKVGPYEGLVSQITWRATRLRTKSGDYVIVPNSIVSKEAIVNYSEPGSPTRLFVEVGVSYDTPPNEVKAVIARAVGDAPLALKTPPPDVALADFGASAITYRAKFWIGDYATDDVARDQVRTSIYYALRRAGMEIPYPMQVHLERDASSAQGLTVEQRAEYLETVDLFAALGEADRMDLARGCHDRLYGTGQTIVREGDHDASLFIVSRGKVRVTVGEVGTEVATINAGGYFGEMALLTGEPRTATVKAMEDCLLLEVTAEEFRRLARAHPDVVSLVTAVVEDRRAGLNRSRTVATAAVAKADVPRTFLERVQQFLRL